jgi:hypothetical protein
MKRSLISSLATGLVSVAIGLGASSFAQAEFNLYGMSNQTAPKDGDLVLPSDYRSWPVFLSNVQRPDLKQIRDIYINQQGTYSSRPFAYGTTMVMELHSVKLDAEGKPVLGADGKMQKAGLSKVFVMGKGDGWGQAVPEEQRNGEWIYSAFNAAGASLGGDAKACRGCHTPLKDTDYVARVTEYEASRVGR